MTGILSLIKMIRGLLLMFNKKSKDKISMKWRMVVIVLICWLLPFLLIIGVAAYYILSNRYGAAAESVVDQLVYNNQICVERLNYGLSASRKATYDQTVENAWKEYGRGDSGYHLLYNTWNSYISKEYRQNQCFSEVIIWGYEDPERINCGVYNTSAGGSYQNIKNYWSEDHKEIRNYLSTLDTSIGYIYTNGRLYMVRNLLDRSYTPFAALIMKLDVSYCFGPIIKSPIGQDVMVYLNNEALLLKGSEFTDEAVNLTKGTRQRGYSKEKGMLSVFDIQKEEYFTVAALINVDESVIQSPFYGYPIVFIGMVLFLIPLLMLLLKVFKQNVTDPIEAILEGSGQVEQGELGYQITKEPENLEFKNLTESFNRMSERLKFLFDHIYEEELALRDAKIMALQSNINPHFMNNTLEIINWEARLGENEKVSRMIEALRTLMDGAMDRKKRAEVPLSEELMYVNAYLYINTERYGKRLTVEKEFDDSILQYKVPRLILQPVIENAIEHGVRPTGHGTVTIRGYEEGEFLYVEITNEGGMSEEDRQKIDVLLDPDYDSSRESTGNLGIANVNQRLKILYGESCGLTIEKIDDNHVMARLTIAIR